MKKKLTFSVIIAFILIISGITAVGAWEGHLVDVKAHVENAVGVTPLDVDFGIMFPQEEVEKEVYIGLSESFRAEEQTRYSSVKYYVCWEPKLIEGHDPILANQPICDPDEDGYFEPLWPWLQVNAEGDTIYEVPVQGDGYVRIGEGILYKADDICDVWHLVFDPPVFAGYYNCVTDPREPSGILEDFCTATENICGFDVDVPYMDFGSNMKFQVFSIVED